MPAGPRSLVLLGPCSLQLNSEIYSPQLGREKFLTCAEVKRHLGGARARHPELSGGPKYPIMPGNTSGSPMRSCTVELGRGKEPDVRHQLHAGREQRKHNGSSSVKLTHMWPRASAARDGCSLMCCVAKVHQKDPQVFFPKPIQRHRRPSVPGTVSISAAGSKGTAVFAPAPANS
ncbi:unnamed protein product [Pleuronectes platessa]|uniref:Uncharacterized protein n=1 Tax=Pleuronectes platessa TaxID=8262 RepID=A0A9N7YDU8_PLEPL|nr:unnamed protein product [Pleuronectes platessa]